MQTIVPDFYKTFRCKADRCEHNCCKGWEIGIDDDTTCLYLELKTPLGDEIRKNIQPCETGYCFTLTKDKKCPFLQEDGLCRIILESDEDNLCEICHMHPRFFTYLENVELAGLGLCCEEVVSLLLATPETLTFLNQKTNERLTLSGVLKLLEIAVDEDDLHFQTNTQIEFLKRMVHRLSKTSPIDESWMNLLKRVQDGVMDYDIADTIMEEQQPIYDKIMHYVIYRQLEKLQYISWSVLLNYACVNVNFIFQAAMMTDDLPEVLRLWSAQMEYDTDNVALLLEE